MSMSTRAQAEGRKIRKNRKTTTSGRVTPSKLRRSAVVAVDGALAVGVGAMAGLFGAASGTASAQAPTPGWTGLQSPAPSGANAPSTNPVENFTSDACANALSCVSAGTYVDVDGATRGLLDALSGGSWSASEAPLPADANTVPDPAFYDTTCAASGTCYAVGG
jgi:hypothetical protein